MIIKNKIVYVYDIEVFPNVFHCLLKNTETKEYIYFEVSERKNQIEQLIDFFSNCQNKMICGYNCIHYDNPIINFILEYKKPMSCASFERICHNIQSLSNIIVSSNDPEKWKRWKYANNFDTLDLLTMLYSQKLRVGLKEMQVTMKYKNVQEYSGKFTDYLLEKDIPEMIMYNKNDVDSTENLLYMCENDIKLRLSIEQEYGIKALNKDGVNLGMEILKIKYLEKTGKTWDDIKDLRSPCDVIDLSKVILPFISYKTPLLQNFLEEFKQQKVGAGRKSFEKHFLLDNLEYSVGVGGIHSVNEPEIIIPNEDEIISDVDVASLYPSLIIEYGFYPPHLGKEFLEVYTQIKNERIEAKHNGNKLKDKTLKLSINGLSGNLQSQFSWCYSPEVVMKIRINGQLFLLMLAEKLIAAGCKILQANTDGLFVLRKKADENKFQAACKEWEQITKLTLEEDRFERFYQFAINDYLAIEEGYNETHNPKLLKKKGMFIDEVTLGKGMAPMIIPKAINAYFADNIPITDTIYNSKDINDFITYQKVSKDFQVEYNKQLITRINRYYISTNGYYLFKCKVDKSGNRYGYINMLCDSGVTICNNLEEFEEFPTNINYNYYIKEANKIISKLEQQQLSLF
ncbi:MAG: hypothetical protein MSC51_03975 [Mollicutes bacterium]|nr:hypothetical protein [Mollicutes bacterium]